MKAVKKIQVISVVEKIVMRRCLESQIHHQNWQFPIQEDGTIGSLMFPIGELGGLRKE
jgi:hypothetical protein